MYIFSSEREREKTKNNRTSTLEQTACFMFSDHGFKPLEATLACLAFIYHNSDKVNIHRELFQSLGWYLLVSVEFFANSTLVLALVYIGEINLNRLTELPHLSVYQTRSGSNEVLHFRLSLLVLYESKICRKELNTHDLCTSLGSAYRSSVILTVEKNTTSIIVQHTGTHDSSEPIA